MQVPTASPSPSTIRAVLFDLDGTLLINDMGVFLPRYLERLSAWVSAIIAPDLFVDALMQATRVMVANDGRATNEEVFAAAFYPLVGRPREALEPALTGFYQRDFPHLRAYCRRRREARSVVQAALERGCDVVIATNPVFPASAIEQRIAWAGVAGLPYRLVTTYENSRACKPNLLYFQQILETIGRRACECLLVGDEDQDMVAGRLGITTFLVGDPPKVLAGDIPTPALQGTLADVGEWMRSRDRRDRDADLRD